MPLTRSLTRPLTGALCRALTDASGSSFSPLSLFAASEQGGWYDFSDLSTMFQDSAGTTPAVVDAVVGKVLDKSGRGNHLIQATAASKPILRLASGRYYLEFDGVDDGMATATTVDFSATDKVTVWAGARKTSDAVTAIICELFTSFTTTTFSLFAPASTVNKDIAFGSRGSGSSASAASISLAPVTFVATGIADIAGDVSTLRLNGAQVATSAADQGAGNYRNATLYVGRRAGTSNPFTGRLFGLIVRGGTSSAAEIAATEAYINGKTGAY